ncbi:MAG: hypothetical protein SNJ77_11660 [Cytophagales bacterium]
MSELEFEVLDELYFAIDIHNLSQQTGINIEDLRDLIWEMKKKDWVKVMRDFDDEIDPEESEFKQFFEKYHYIASKKGLLLHNSK